MPRLCSGNHRRWINRRINVGQRLFNAGIASNNSQDCAPAMINSVCLRASPAVGFGEKRNACMHAGDYLIIQSFVWDYGRASLLHKHRLVDDAATATHRINGHYFFVQFSTPFYSQATISCVLCIRLYIKSNNINPGPDVKLLFWGK